MLVDETEEGLGRKAVGENLLSFLEVAQTGRRGHSKWSATKLRVRLGNWNLQAGRRVKIMYVIPGQHGKVPKRDHLWVIAG